MKRLHWLLAISCLLLAVGCARMGQPDGGWYDDTPPRVIGATPGDKATDVKAKKITIYFNEYIKLEDAQNKVIVSPPQLEMPEIKATGTRIVVELKDSLKENTTYTVDFGDAISDNNEGNPMGNYTYSFSTGERIDTFEVAGYVLNAEDLEPLKGIMVGVYDDLSDTVLKTKPMIRISRTDGNGHFTVKGLAPGTYRAYALKDADGDFVFSQKSEMVAFNHDTFSPSSKPDTRQDTIWRDTLHIDNILIRPYTHFLPDDITLLAFTAEQTDRQLIKTERKEPERLDVYFTYGNEQLPVMHGLNFDSSDAFVLEKNERQDSLYYWLKDTALVNQDTLRIEMQYLMSDSTSQLISKTDTIEFLPKVSYEKRMKERQKELEKLQKEQAKKNKKRGAQRGAPKDTPKDAPKDERDGAAQDSTAADNPPLPVTLPVKPLEVKILSSGLSPEDRLVMEVPVPLARLDTAAIQLLHTKDSVTTPVPFTFSSSSVNIRQYIIDADWKEAESYTLKIDSAALETIYGLTSAAVNQSIKIKGPDECSMLTVNLAGAKEGNLVVQLLDSQGKVTRQKQVQRGSVTFRYLNPGNYYLRAFADANGNNKWDTGDYDADLQAERVYYYPEVTECKAKWDMTRSWDLNSTPTYKQKPGALIKQKGDKAKKLQNRNAQRAKQLGIEYIQDKTGIKL